MIDFNKYKILTFDCYGTLIDWEGGILTALKPVLIRRNINIDDSQILELYAGIESEIEKGEFIKYKEVLKEITQKFGDRFGFAISAAEKDCLVDSLQNWKPFSDTVEALRSLKRKFKLGIISNVDNDLFAFSNRLLEIKFDYVITAEQVKSYKPSLDNFKFAIKEIGLPVDSILHVAQSIYHDIVPAKLLGLSTVWVNRRKGKEGFGATPPANGQADIEVPNLKALTSMVNL